MPIFSAHSDKQRLQVKLYNNIQTGFAVRKRTPSTAVTVTGHTSCTAPKLKIAQRHIKTMHKLARFFGATLGLIGMTACSVFGESGVEKAPYTIVLQEEAIEIREYSPLVLASTISSGDFDEATSTSFRRLFNYISGENIARQAVEMTAPVLIEESGQKIDMTAPVLIAEAAEGWKMSFHLPSAFTFETAPAPTNQQVFLEKIEPQTIAALRFSGLMSRKKVEAMREELIKWLDEKGYIYNAKAYKVASYNPPWTIPFLRRNEIMIPVKE
ncbi:SOUL heme-binding protein [Nitrosomonas halophila]|uniref:SOUL heme-binding protein n=2 Tax=Nitrosomonas halophila TaxID=44576 RepID=A0A1H3K3V5_9PROT|nr:SOUL heme-binding protein [Nitrosomonas halophila]